MNTFKGQTVSFSEIGGRDGNHPAIFDFRIDLMNVAFANVVFWFCESVPKPRAET